MDEKIHSEYFNRKSEEYDDYIKLLPAYEKIIEEIQELAEPKSTHTIMDIGIGTGLLSFELAKKAKKIIGIDISEKMLERAEKNFREKGIENIELKKMNCIDLKIEDSSMDTIISNLVIHHLDDKEKETAIKEMHRVLKNSGKIVIGDLIRTEKGIDEMTANIVGTVRSKYGDSATIKILAQAMKKMFLVPEYPATEEFWKCALEKEGFKDISIRQINGPLFIIYAEK